MFLLSGAKDIKSLDDFDDVVPAHTAGPSKKKADIRDGEEPESGTAGNLYVLD